MNRNSYFETRNCRKGRF